MNSCSRRNVAEDAKGQRGARAAQLAGSHPVCVDQQHQCPRTRRSTGGDWTTLEADRRFAACVAAMLKNCVLEGVSVDGNKFGVSRTVTWESAAE